MILSNEPNGNNVSVISPTGSSDILQNIPVGSLEHLVPIRSRSTVFKKKRVYGLKLVICLIVLIILLLIAVITLSVIYAKSVRNRPKRICESVECIRSAANLAMSMDRTANPCEDFYQFTCGHWGDEHPKPDSRLGYDWFADRQEHIYRQLRTFLKRNNSKEEPLPVQQARDLYKSCMDTDAMDALEYEPIYDFLESVGLPRIPHFFNISSENNLENFHFDWIEVVVNIKRKIRKDIFIGFSILPDPRNRSVNRMTIGFPYINDPFPRLIDKKMDERISKILFKKISDKSYDYDDDGEYIGHDIGNDNSDTDYESNNLGKDSDDNDDDSENDPKIIAYRTYLQTVMRSIILNSNITEVPSNFDENVVKAVSVYRNVTKGIYKLVLDSNTTVGNETYEDDLQDLIDMTVDELQNYTDNYLIENNAIPTDIWRTYITLLFNNTGVELNLNTTDQLILNSADLEYLKLIAEYLSKLPNIILELFTWWSAIENMIVHTTSEIRELKQKLYLLLTNVEETRLRSLHCTNVVDSLMGMAASYSIANKSFLSDTKPKVQAMFNDIKSAFKKLIQKNDWMDRKTKMATIEKCENMRSLIGFPEWILDNKGLSYYYEGFVINSTQHLSNMIGILQLTSTYMLRRLHRTNLITWATIPTEVNAFHTFQMNTITIPMAILQYPFYNLGLEALHYGAIGSILGHELTHGFDDTGRQFDKHGNLYNWWTDKTAEEYVNRTQCFVKQYNNFVVPEANKHVNGKQTLGENIADNGGLAETIHAYKLYQQRNGIEPLLPGFEEFSHLQLLFIAYGNVWCEIGTPEYYKINLDSDSHSPGRIRLHGAVINMKEFASAFKCPKGSPMNPIEKRCSLW